MHKLLFCLLLHFAFAKINYLQPETAEQYVILDTDMGGDDACAIQMLIKAEEQLKKVKLLAVTTVDGNTDMENVIKNTYRILHGMNRTDIPIYKGASEPIVPMNLKRDFFYGVNGFSDIDFWKPDYPTDIDSIIQEENAVEIIRELVMKHPKQVSVLCFGPLTNIALAIKTFPEIKENIKEIYIMGGGIRGRGNIIPAAEFNFYRDPESVSIVLNSKVSSIKILPVDVDEHLNITFDWRFNTLGKVSNHTNIHLLNQIDEIAFRNSSSFLSYDSLTTAAFLFPERVIEKINPYNLTMELQGYHTRGQTIINHQSTDFNVNIIEKVSENEYKEIMIWSASAMDDRFMSRKCLHGCKHRN